MTQRRQPQALLVVLLFLGLLLPALGKRGLKPEQVHLSLTGNPTEMVIQWVTWEESSGSAVKYSSADMDPQIMAATTTTYRETGWAGFIHTVVIPNLKPDTVYSYSCGNEGQWSDTYYFRTEPQGISDMVHVAVLGDMGLDQESDNTVASLTAAVRAGTYDFVLHAGDIAYTYDDDTGTNQTRFDAYMNKIEPVVAYAPYMVCAGNQEFPYLFAEYRNRFRMPYAESGSQDNLWFSFNVGPMHYVAISTEHHLNPGSPQYEWLEADLKKANANRQSQPWVVVYGHRPLYCSNAIDDASWFKDCYVMAPGLRGFLEPLFHKYAVDIYFAGHMHDAEFTYPLYQSQVTNWNFNNPSATVHIISGYAGCREGFNGFSNDTQFGWSVWRQAEHYGYGHLAYNTTHVHFQYLYADDNRVHKELMIVKDKTVLPRPEEQRVPSLVPKPATKVQDALTTLNVFLARTKITEGDMKDFLIGFGIGLGVEFGSIPECIADYYPLEYVFTSSFKLIEDGFEQMNFTEIGVGFRVFFAGLKDLEELINDCGGIPGAEDFLGILVDFYKYGAAYVGWEEVAKVVKNYPTLEGDIRLAVTYWDKGLYQQSGIMWGQVVGIMVKP